MKSTTYLVTGGGGFLGRYVLGSLVEQGDSVTVLGRTPLHGWRTILADLTSSEINLLGESYSTVYHLAGLAHRIPSTESERDMFFRVNVLGLKNLLHALERSGELPRAIVLASSVAVYGVDNGILLDEATPRAAVDPYGASKREAEDALMEWSARHSVRATILRLPLVCGKGAPGNLGTMMQSLACGRYLGIGSGSARRSMVLARDVAEILPKAAQ
ncbi:MAG TPA: NAD-dependent epimerase/dehydratase family protein, partial [Pyrinomonadaceae bacterium]|nr:NAD-dependent epimerase/dehydratase family protein [Pyrinomonadaceae bacterium]